MVFLKYYSYLNKNMYMYVIKFYGISGEGKVLGEILMGWFFISFCFFLIFF